MKLYRRASASVSPVLKAILVMGLLAHTACAPKAPPNPGTQIPPVPEIKNFLPFQVVYASFLREDKVPFGMTALAAVLRIDAKHQAVFEHTQVLNNLPERNLSTPFRPVARLSVLGSALEELSYEVQGASGKASGRFDSEGSADLPWFLRGDEVVSISQKTGKKLTVKLPGAMNIFTLMRFTSGAIIPVPARLDTLVLDPARDQLFLIWRSTFLTEPQVRKLEWRGIFPKHISKSKPSFTAWGEPTVDFLNRCPVPTQPGEACANPELQKFEKRP